jgi:flagellar motility protein MotE (MotC chaperone)
MPKRLALTLLLVLAATSATPIPAVGQGPEASTAGQQQPVAHPTTPYFVAAVIGLAGAIGIMWKSHGAQVKEVTLEVAKQVEAATKANANELATTRAEHQRILELERAASKSKVDELRAALDREREDHRRELDEVRERLDQEQRERRVESAQLLREQKEIMREVLTLCDNMRHVIERNTETIREVANRFPAG